MTTPASAAADGHGIGDRYALYGHCARWPGTRVIAPFGEHTPSTSRTNPNFASCRRWKEQLACDARSSGLGVMSLGVSKEIFRYYGTGS